MNYWFLITSIGSSLVTIPIAVTIAAWLLASREWKMAFYWCFLFGLAMLLVLATKIAFVGWGVGIESLDFTGISGHAARSAAVFPLLFYFGLQPAPRKIFSWPLCLGVALGLLIAISRVMVNAHSSSEIIAGWLLGSSVSFGFLISMSKHYVLISRRWLLLCSLIFLFVSPIAKPVPTESLIIKTALFLSGHHAPNTRAMWGHVHKEMHFL